MTAQLHRKLIHAYSAGTSNKLMSWPSLSGMVEIQINQWCIFGIDRYLFNTNPMTGRITRIPAYLELHRRAWNTPQPQDYLQTSVANQSLIFNFPWLFFVTFNSFDLTTGIMALPIISPNAWTGDWTGPIIGEGINRLVNGRQGCLVVSSPCLIA